MSCPPPDVLGRFVDDQLSPEERLSLEQHVDECDECRSTVAMLARAATAERRSSGDIDVDPGAEGYAPTELASTTNTSSARLASGTKLGRYVIVDILGVGGMGVVYAARDPELDRDIAIKVLRSELVRAQPDAAQRIAREAQAMARIAHPNVVNVFDVGTVEGQVFVAMERVHGKNLRAWFADGRHTVAEILEVFIAAGRGLIAAHDAGIVHRDFKPDNVLVGNDGRVRVTDFGLAFDRASPGERSVGGSETTTRPIAGTPAYMAPEQHAGGNADPRTDQFSFAVSLYEALYGVRPFAGKTRDELADAVIRGRVGAAPLGTRVPHSLRAILVRALSVTPGDRYPTLGELLKALGRDRGRRPRQIAFATMIGFALVAVAFVSDVVLRERTHAITRTSFTAAREQLDRLLASRTDTFVAQSDALYRLPALQEVAATHDLADFGLGDPAEDRARIERIHDNFRSADWLSLARTREGDVLAVTDHKGRLVYDSANPTTWGNDIASIPAIAAAYDARSEVYLGVLHGNDPAVVASGLLGDQRPQGLFVMFARTKRINDQPRALFVHLLDAAHLLQDVAVADTQLAVVAPDGRSEGSVPASLIARARGDGIAEVASDGKLWLVERTPLRAKGQGDAIAQLVVARQTNLGLSGLFPHARVTLGALALALATIAIGGLVTARRRDLAKRRA